MGNNRNWSAPTTQAEVFRRASGRRHYHAIRRFRRDHRRLQVAELLTRYGMGWGYQARIARELGVSRVTIHRDMKYLLESYLPCPVCGSVVHRDQIDGGRG